MMMEKSNLINYLKEEGFSKKIVEAFEKVDREKFVREDLQEYAYVDTALPLGHGQTISQPFTIAFMLSLLEVKSGQKILEVGSGSGYVLALLSEMNSTGEIFGLERISELANFSRNKLEEKKNIKVLHVNGFEGLESESPFDRILVSAAAEEIPKKLFEQLKVGGILVIPIKNSIVQIKKSKEGVKAKEHEGFCFVPLIK